LKKFILIALSLIFTLSLAACGQETVTYNPENPYWMKEGSYGTTVDKSVNEVCIYDVTYLAATEPSKTLAAEIISGTYKTELTASTFDEKDCYLLTATLNVTGKYSALENGTAVDSVEFTDVTVNKTYFTWNNGIKTLCSIQQAESTLPANANGIVDDNGNRFVKIAFEAKIVYGDKNAETEFKIVGTEDEVAKMKPYFALEDGYKGTIKKYASKNYIDSTMLFFAPRSFDFAEGLSYSFNSIASLEHKLHSMMLTTNTVPTVSVDVNVNYNGDAITKTEPAYQLDIKINETYKGQAITATYLENATSWHHFMYKLVTPLRYNTGYLVYTLKEVQNS